MRTDECRAAAEHLLAYLENPARRTEGETALNHIQACPYCQRRIGQLSEALTSDEPSRLTCRVCQELLPDYLQAQADQARWRPVAQHLNMCPQCLAAYEDLADLLELAQGKRGAEPPGYPVPELPFLRPKRAGPRRQPHIRWRLDALGQLVIEFSTGLLRTLQPPAYGVAGVKAGTAPGPIRRFALTDAVEDLEVAITIEAQQGDPTRCMVTVEAKIPSRGGWPNLAGTMVTLKRGTQELEARATDPFGRAIFAGIATADLPQLVFVIAPGKDGQ